MPCDLVTDTVIKCCFFRKHVLRLRCPQQQHENLLSPRQTSKGLLLLVDELERYSQSTSPSSKSSDKPGLWSTVCNYWLPYFRLKSTCSRKEPRFVHMPGTDPVLPAHFLTEMNSCKSVMKVSLSSFNRRNQGSKEKVISPSHMLINSGPFAGLDVACLSKQNMVTGLTFKQRRKKALSSGARYTWNPSLATVSLCELGQIISLLWVSIYFFVKWR